MKMRRFVMLDRDGTIIRECDHLSDPNDVELLEGAAAGLRTLRNLGCGLVVVTNQPGIGRGQIDEARLGEIHARMNTLLAAEGVTLDGIYYCPHAPEANCDCRKPAAGLALRAAGDHGFVLTESFVIGDKRCDIDLGRNIGATSILVRTGYGDNEARQPDLKATHVCRDLLEAASVIEGYGK